MIDEILGKVSAYAYAVEKGYTGTETQFAYDLAHAADYASTAGTAAENASESEENAKDSEEAAAQSEGNAEGYAQSAHDDAAAALEAKGQAIAAKNDAVTAKGLAENSATIANSAKIAAAQSEQNAYQFAESAEQDAGDASNSASSASTSSLKSEGFAVGEQNGVPVESGSPYYENNSKYYSEQAAAQLGLVTAEGTRQIGLVTDEGTAQKAAVQEKGEQTLASIPEDYTTLRNDVSELKSDLRNIENVTTGDASTTFTAHFEQGSISNVGAETVSSIRIRSGYYNLNFLQSISITPANGYKIAISLYNADGSYKRELGFTNDTRVISPGTGNNDAYYIRILLSRNDDTTIVPGDADGNITIVASSVLSKKLLTLNNKINEDLTDFSVTSSWSYGSISGSTGTISNTQTRIHTIFKRVDKGAQIFATFNNDINASKYDVEAVMIRTDGSISGSGWKNNVYEIPENCWLGINARKKDNSVITSEDFTDIVNNVFFTANPINQSWLFNGLDMVKAVNHRGWHEAPENTLIAYIQSYQHNFRFVETDIRFTSDNIPVCLHDNTINRTGRNPDGSVISNTINISDITYQQALQYDFGIYKGTQYAGTKIPTLAEFCQLCKKLNLLPYIDIGSTPALTESQIRTIVDTINNNGLHGKASYLVGRLSYGIVITQKDKHARIGCVTTLNTVFTTYANAFKTGYNNVFMDTQYQEATAAAIPNAINDDLPVEIWTVNDTTIIDNMDPYISGVSSDSINVNEYLRNSVLNT